MTGVSWHRGCPVRLGRLRLLTVDYWGFDGALHRGGLVVNRDVAAGMLQALHSLYRLRFPIRRMRLVDAYGADDHRSMGAITPPPSTAGSSPAPAAGSSAPTAGRSTQPDRESICERSSDVSPPAGTRFTDRSQRAQGLIHRGGPVVAAFADAG
jgi:hypothetical protein